MSEPLNGLPDASVVAIVDDDEAVRDGLALLLRSVGLPTRCYADAQAFLVDADDAALGCVLLDIRMPELDGLEAARLIRTAEAALGRERTLPILALTANVAEPDRRAALSAGMDDCLAKPLEREVLRGWIDRVAGGSAQSLSA